MKKLGWHLTHRLTGVHLSSSTLYLDWSEMSGSFPVPESKIRQMLPSKSLDPVQFTAGTTTVVFRAIEVRKARGLSPYNEFSVEVPVVYRGTSKVSGLPGSCVLYMPVTTEEARWGGVEIVGLPKFIANIQFEDAGETRRCRVQADGKDLITLEVRKLETNAQSWDWYIYGVRDGQLLRTHIGNQGQRGVAAVRGGSSYTLGDHPVAEELRSLEIDAKSIEHEFVPKFHSLEDRPLKVK